MKQYYTLVEPFREHGRSIGEYLEDNKIDYRLGAEDPRDLKEFGLQDFLDDKDLLVKTYSVLLDEHELSAIRLSVEKMSIIQVRPSTRLYNRIRSVIGWMTD